jgi:CHASE2 domain-containing sensor protein
MDLYGQEYKLYIALVVSIVGFVITYVNGKMVQIDRYSSHQNLCQVVIGFIALLIGLSFHVWLFMKIGWYAPIVTFLIGNGSLMIFIYIASKPIEREYVRKFLFGVVAKNITIFEIVIAGLTLMLWV